MPSPLTLDRGIAASGLSRSHEQFPDPFCDMASLAMPDTMQDALRWCEFLLVKNGPYREAINRVISYFLTDVEIISKQGDNDDRVGREEKQKYLDFLNDTIGIRGILGQVALDYLGYGNSFTSLIIPFRRYLSCKGCGNEAPLKKVYNNPSYGFRWSGYEFHANCPQCGYSGQWRHIDRRSGDKDDIKVKRWSPHEIEILPDPYTGDRAFIWKIPEYYRDLIRRGHLYHLERAPWEVVRAVRDNMALMFDDDIIYHMREEPLAGLRTNGWGFSKVLVNFSFAYLNQSLWRQTEAIALDYILPFRVLTPQPRAGQGGEINDPVLSMNMGSFVARVNKMLQERRRDPAKWNILPFPLEYQALGGDATQFAPHELLKLSNETLLSAIGVPIQMFNGDMSMQVAPAAMRLFEANWSHLVYNLNRFLNRLVEKISQVMSWEPVTARLQRVTHADDLNRQMAKMQLMTQGQISRTTGLGTVGLDFAEEERRKLEEERISAEAAADMQKEMDQAAQMDEMAAPPPPQQGGAMPTFQGMPGAMPGGGVPAAGGGGGAGGAGGGAPPPGPAGMPPGPYGASQSFGAQVGSTPADTPETLQQKADTIASQVMTMPESQKDSYLINLKKSDPTMHALVTSLIEDKRRQAELQGRDMMLAQMYGKQARAIQLPFGVE